MAPHRTTRMLNQDKPHAIQLPDGMTTSIRWDDIETGNNPGVDAPTIIVDERLTERLHDMPETWLRARVRGWLEVTESPSQAWWIGTYSADRRWLWASSEMNTYTPLQHRIEYARRVCLHINKTSRQGGVWFAGWIRGGSEFYLMWKDADGDICVPLECDRPFTIIQNWNGDVWVNHCETALAVRKQWVENMELSKTQRPKVAQGERVSPEHYDIGDRVAGLT